MTPRQIRRSAERQALKAGTHAADTQPATISEAQLAANRANAQLSTGPLSPEGKEKVSQNRVTHGLAGTFRLLG